MAEVIKGEAPKSPKAEFDITKGYKWEPTDKFVLDGLEFARLFQTVNAEMNFGGIPLKMKVELYDMVVSILKQAVESGVATEVAQPTSLPEPAPPEATVPQPSEN